MESKKNTTKKVAAKKTTSATKKTTTKKATTAKKPVVKTSTIKKSTTKTTTAKKPVAKKPAAAKKPTVEKKEIKIEVEKEIETKPEIKVEENPIKEHIEKEKIKIIFRLIVILAIIFISFFVITKFFLKKETYKDKATYSNAFFIKNSKGKYALFNESGKKLTNFAFDSASSFISNVALVHNDKEGYAIINNKGKNIVPYGKYNYISSYSGLFKVRSDKGYKLLDSKGNTLIDSDTIEINSFGEDYPFNIVIADNEVKIISYDGKTIKSFKENKSAKSPTVNHIDEIATFFYDGKNVIFNTKTKKIITEFKNQNHYCINGMSEDKKILTLNSCVSWFESQEKVNYIVVVKNNITDLSDDCNNITLYDDVIVCTSSTGNRIVNIKGNKAKLGNKVNSRVGFIDEKNYVVKDNDTNKIDFYKNNKKVKTMDASLSSIGKVYSGLYVIYVDNGYEYYNKEGKQAIKENYKQASSFDKNGVARVSKDGINYYLINKKGKKISAEYTHISNYGEYYQVTNNKNLKGIIDKKGKEIIPCKYTNINIRELRDKYYAIGSIDDSKYALYDLSSEKLIKEAKNTITINEHYIKVSGTKTSYYTYKNKLIYQE